MGLRLLAVVLSVYAIASAQNATVFIQSIAGSTVFDNRPATQTPLVQPPAVWVHPNGDIFVADGNFLVRRVRAGMSTIVAGGGELVDDSVPIPAKSAKLDYPSALAGANSGELYMTDLNHNRIRRLNNDGTMVTVAGRGTNGYSGDGGRGVFAELSKPRAIALSSTGDLYIADSGNYVVRKLNTVTGFSFPGSRQIRARSASVMPARASTMRSSTSARPMASQARAIPIARMETFAAPSRSGGITVPMRGRPPRTVVGARHQDVRSCSVVA